MSQTAEASDSAPFGSPGWIFNMMIVSILVLTLICGVVFGAVYLGFNPFA